MDVPIGLSQTQAAELLTRVGPNAIPPERRSALRTLLGRLWGPVPWVLELALLGTLLTARYGDGAAIAFLLLFNASVAAVQEGRAREAVEMLRKRVVVQARVKRDGVWRTISGDGLVPGDLIHVGVGDVIPADVNVVSGTLQADESVLTGESMPHDVQTGGSAYAGTIVVRGDATALVGATGTATRFGKTAELVRIAHAPGQLERLVLRMVSVLTAISAVLVAVIAVFALHLGMSAIEIGLFAVMLLLASVPVALPAAFTLATTLGSLDLARRGALVTRLSALEDAATMDVLCTDKTGTITKNRLTVGEIAAFESFSAQQVAALAAAASDRAEREPVDLIVLDYAAAHETPALPRSSFTPFDPAKKWSSAAIQWNGGQAVAFKGAPDVLRATAKEIPARFDAEFERLAGTGARMLAVALRQAEVTRMAGLIALSDPPREDAARIVGALRGSGVDVVLLTGDTAATAQHVAHEVGIDAERVHASVYPQDKLSIIRSLQKSGHVVGMTGDGVNDAPALRQANIGIAVSSATDVAKAAAGIILTQPGLADILAAVQSSRAVFERMVTYTMMKLIKYFEIIGVLTLGFFVTKRFLLTPELMVALLIFNDFVTLSISTDNVPAAATKRSWRFGGLLAAALLIAIVTAGSVIFAVAYAQQLFHASPAQTRSLTFFALVAMGQIAVYVVRSREAIFGMRPSRPLLAASAAALVGCAAMAVFGVLMPPLPPSAVYVMFAVLAAAGCVLAALKLPLFALAGLRKRAAAKP